MRGRPATSGGPHLLRSATSDLRPRDLPRASLHGHFRAGRALETCLCLAIRARLQHLASSNNAAHTVPSRS